MMQAACKDRDHRNNSYRRQYKGLYAGYMNQRTKVTA